MTELEHYLKSYFTLNRDELKKIESFFEETEITKGGFFLKQGSRCDKLSFIRSGYLRIFAATEEKEVTQWISTKGYFVTDLSSFVFETPARWSIQALSDVRLYTIKKSDYNLIGRVIPDWHKLEKLFIARCFTILEDRIFSHLSMSAEERYAFFFENNKELFTQVPLQFIASMLGMTPETFSRIRKKNLL